MKRLTFQIYLIYGPIIGTSVFIFGFLMLFISFNPLGTLQGFVDPQILEFLVFILILGYFIGLIPALISAILFYRLKRKCPQHRHLDDYIYCGFLAALPWMLVAAVAIMYDPDYLFLALFLSGISMISSIACAAYIWRKMAQRDQNLPPELPKISA